MASALSRQIRCPVCWNDLKDPVCLPCEHFYCRVCITQHLANNIDDSRCPECRSPYTQADIRVSRALRNIVDAAKDHLREHQALRQRAMSLPPRTETQTRDFTEQCLCHNEALKLFCVTDQKLICVICKEEETHQGHSIKTLHDAFQAKKKKTCEALESLFSEEDILVDLINGQAEEIVKTMEKSKALSMQVSAQFKKLNQFLKDKERAVKKLLEEEENQILDIMGVNIFTMEEMLSDGREKQGILRSTLEMDQPCQFLQWWNENGRSLIRDTFSCRATQPTPQDLSVKPDTLFLGPYETHLQFFVWKEMLKFVQLVPHHHTVEDGGNQSISISPSGLCVQPKKVSLMKKTPNLPWLKTVSSFNTGQHYWEVEVGKKLDWGVGVCSFESGKVINDTVLCFSSDSGYHIQQTHDTDRRTIDLTLDPKKIGVYLDCERNQVSFYNANSMILIDTRVLSKPLPHSLCVSPGLYLNGKNSDPLTICWY